MKCSQGEFPANYWRGMAGITRSHWDNDIPSRFGISKALVAFAQSLLLNAVIIRKWLKFEPNFSGAICCCEIFECSKRWYTMVDPRFPPHHHRRGFETTKKMWYLAALRHFKHDDRKPRGVSRLKTLQLPFVTLFVKGDRGWRLPNFYRDSSAPAYPLIAAIIPY